MPLSLYSRAPHEPARFDRWQPYAPSIVARLSGRHPRRLQCVEAIMAASCTVPYRRNGKFISSSIPSTQARSSCRSLATRNQLCTHQQLPHNLPFETYHADIIPIQQNLWQLRLVAIVVTAVTSSLAHRSSNPYPLPPLS